MGEPSSSNGNEWTNIRIRRSTKEKLDRIGGSASYDRKVDGIADTVIQGRLVERPRRRGGPLRGRTRGEAAPRFKLGENMEPTKPTGTPLGTRPTEREERVLDKPVAERKAAEVYLAYVEVGGRVLVLATGSSLEELWANLEPLRRLNAVAKEPRLHVAHAEGATAEAVARAFSGARP